MLDGRFDHYYNIIELQLINCLQHCRHLLPSCYRATFQAAWMSDFEQELTRRKIFVQPGSAAFNHFAFFKSKPRTRQMSDDSSVSIFGTQSLAKRLIQLQLESE